ncbi:MAG: hypothetical protein PHU49_02040 [Syntrophorhabdaceae bacterium]|nr:hypothetical protein [Syntrophorhabdaceae bacterium]MDD5242773.1 hypothetical protein [Syntrophorhabdaceae bacterium]
MVDTVNLKHVVEEIVASYEEKLLCTIIDNTQTVLGEFEEITSSYEDRLQSLSTIIDNTQTVLGEYQDSMSNTKQERERLKIELRDILARNESLRKKDFDTMMNTILLSQDDREREVRGLLNGYLTEQRDMAKTIRENLGSFRGSLNRDNIDRIKEFHQMLQDILKKQEERKAEVTTKLRAFQKEQSELSSTLVELLSKGRELRIKDLKLMLKQFKTQSKERAVQHLDRKENVQMMLNSFRKERLERVYA